MCRIAMRHRAEMIPPIRILNCEGHELSQVRKELSENLTRFMIPELPEVKEQRKIANLLDAINKKNNEIII